MYWKDKKLFITGANGFVGANAVNYFLKLGCHITAVISNNITDEEINWLFKDMKNDIKFIRSDLTNPNDVSELFTNTDAVLHFAGKDGNAEYKILKSADIFSQNVRMNINVLETAAKKKVKDFLLVSSAEVDKLDSLGDVNDGKGYILSKYISELYSYEVYKQYGLRVVIIRPSNLYGPGDSLFHQVNNERIIPKTIKSLILDDGPITIWGDGNQERSFLYIDDFLKICAILIEKSVLNKPVNVASRHNIKIKDLVKLLMELVGKKSNINFDLNKPTGVRMLSVDTSHLESITENYRERTLRKGLVETINYYKNLCGQSMV